MPIEPNSKVWPSGAAFMTCAGGKLAVGAGPVLDDDGLAEPILQLAADEAREIVEPAAGGVGDHDVDIPGRV